MVEEDEEAYLRVRCLSTKVRLLSGLVEVAVRSTLEIRLLAEHMVQELVIEFVVEVDKDWDWCQRRGSEVKIRLSGDHEGRYGD
jgi:hypothetical protein